MNLTFPKILFVAFILSVTACVIAPAYDPGPPQPAYGYYGYEPAYPWALGANVDIIGGYGHGGYGHGGYGRGGGYGGRGGRR